MGAIDVIELSRDGVAARAHLRRCPAQIRSGERSLAGKRNARTHSNNDDDDDDDNGTSGLITLKITIGRTILIGFAQFMRP